MRARAAASIPRPSLAFYAICPGNIGGTSALPWAQAHSSARACWCELLSSAAWRALQPAAAATMGHIRILQDGVIQKSAPGLIDLMDLNS
jgi:hypothetical protein